MKREYDFGKGKRGPVIPIRTGKTRITIRIDDDVLDWFREQVNAAGGGNYQKLINLALRKHMSHESDEYARAMKRQLRTMKNAKKLGLTGRPTWTRDELHERHPEKKKAK